MTLNKILRYTAISAIFLIPFLALVVSSSLFFPYITGKNFLFRILVEIGFVSWAMLAFRDSAYRPRWRSPIVLALSIFMLIVFLADLFGVTFYKSFWSNFERMEGYITFLHLFGFFFVANVLLSSTKLWQRFFHLNFAIGIILGFNGLLQHFKNGIGRIDATLGNSTYLGALMLFNIFFLLFFFLRTINNRLIKNRKYYLAGYIAAIIFDTYILFLTGTRGAFLGLLAGIIFIALILAIFQKKEKALRMTGIGLLTLVVLGVGFLLVFRDNNIVKNTFIGRFAAPVNAIFTGNIQKFTETEGKGRLLIWGAAINGVKERPVLGWGQENFNYIFNKYYTPQMYSQEQWFDRSHNVFLDWLTQAGVLGLLSYLSIFGVLLYGIWKKRNNDFSLEDKAILTGLIIAYFIHNLFVFDNITSYIFFFSLLAYVNRRQFESVEGERKIWNINPDIANFALTPLVGIVVIAALYFGVVRPYIASASLIQALVDEQSGNVAATTADFKRALFPFNLGSPEAREQLLLLVPAVGSSPNIDAATKQSVISFAESQAEDQLRRTPNDARYHLFYGYALDHLGSPQDLVKAESYLEKASALSPGKQTILFELGLNHLAQNDNAGALTILKRAYDTEPRYDEARITYIMALIYTTHFGEAASLLQGADATVLNDDRILKAYYVTKQFQSAIDVYHAREAASSTNVQNYLGAAGFYLVIKNPDAALAELIKLEAISPEYKSQIDGFIKQIKEGKNPLPIR